MMRMPAILLLLPWACVEAFLLCKRFGRKGYVAFSLLATTAAIFVLLQVFALWSNLQLIAKIEAIGASSVSMSGHILPGPVNYVSLGSDVGDDELAHILALDGLQSLEYVVADDSRISDTGLSELRHFSCLKHVYIGNTNVTQNGVNELQDHLPDCTIVYDPDR